MILSQLSTSELQQRLQSSELVFQTGPFVVGLQSPLPQVRQGLQELYADFPIIEERGFVDFHISLQPSKYLRRWIKPQVLCRFDGVTPFPPLSVAQSFPLFETSLNWYIYSEVFNFLIIHAGAVERNGYAVILPAKTGSGKSTLTAALTHRGWRLLTDELTLIAPSTKHIFPLARPVSLKNESIQVIKNFAPDAILGTNVSGTAKGTVAYMKPPTQSVTNMDQPASPKFVIFPLYQAQVPLTVKTLDKAEAFVLIADGLVNYPILGIEGFHTLTHVIETTECYSLIYSDLREAIAWFDTLLSHSHESFHGPNS